MKAIFADASFYVAWLSPRDAHHSQALQFAASNKTTVVTTEFVLVEVVNFFSKLQRRSAAVRLIHQLRSDQDTVVIAASSDLVERGFELFSRRPDKEWSLTDCISFVVMEEQGITNALTSDGDFEQAGFKALLL